MNDNRKVFIAGTGKSGIAAAKMVLQMGGEVLLYNSSQDTNVQEVMAQFERTDHIQIICGELRPVNLRGVHLAIVSPGIPLTADFITVLDRARVPVIGELELAYQASKGKLAAITGTNGKTTTTALVGEILKKHYNDVHVAGNIGEPFSAEALRTTEESATVVEVSSFMLETINEFKPHVSAILNITPDHLDRHKTMTNYIRCKKAIAINQTRDDFIVLNYSDPELRRFGKSKDLKPKVVWFSSQKKPEGNVLYLSDDCILLRENGK